MSIDIAEIMSYSKTLNILYVEDNEDTREITTMLFSEIFQSVLVAKDGEDGYEKFQESSVDLIITDINMPKLNGTQMIQKIRVLNADVPIIISSAYNEEYVEEVDSLHIQGYLMKPMDLEQLFQLILDLSKSES